MMSFIVIDRFLCLLVNEAHHDHPQVEVEFGPGVSVENINELSPDIVTMTKKGRVRFEILDDSGEKKGYCLWKEFHDNKTAEGWEIVGTESTEFYQTFNDLFKERGDDILDEPMKIWFAP